MPNCEFLECNDIVPAFVPVNLATAANNGDWVNMANAHRCLIVLFKGIGTASEDPVFTLRQATSNAGAGAKALTFTKIRSKVGATALSGVGTWTTTAQTAANTYEDLTCGENESLIAVEVKAEDLDAAGGFTHVQFQVPDVGDGAQLGCGLYLLFGLKHPQATPLSSL